jgi:hypothetical protein
VVVAIELAAGGHILSHRRTRRRRPREDASASGELPPELQQSRIPGTLSPRPRHCEE